MNHMQKYGFKDFKLCDTHIHLVFPETLESTEKAFREKREYFNYTRIALMALTAGSGHRSSDATNNLKALYLKDKFNSETKDSTFVYGNPIYFFDERDTADSLLEQAKTLYALGADGYKFLDGKPSLRKKLGRKLCDPIYDKMYAFAEEMGMPVKMHVADPPRYWGPKETMTDHALSRGWWCGDGTYPSFQELHDEVYGILKKFPKLKFCAAHCFYLGHDIEQLTRFLEDWENTSFDLTPGQFNLVEFSKKPDEAKAFLKKYKSRIFFGTDTYNSPVQGNDLSKYDAYDRPSISRAFMVRRFFEKSPDEAFDVSADRLVPLALDDETVSEIYFGSHQKLHPHAREVDRDLLRFESKKMLEDISSGNITFAEESEYKLESDNLRTIIEYLS